MILYRRIQPVSTLSFDLDDTLYDNRPVLRQAEAWLDQVLKRDYSNIPARTPHSWHHDKKALMRANPALAQDVSALRLAWFEMALDKAGYAGSKDKARDLLQAFIDQRSQLQLEDSVVRLLEDLAQRYTLIALTNGNINLEVAGLAPFFSYADQAGDGTRMKPWPDMYQKAEQALGIRPEQCLHIGDSLATDVLGARRAGWHSAWFNHDFATGHVRHVQPPGQQLPDLELTHLEQLRLLL